jgi:hypothetical protein
MAPDVLSGFAIIAPADGRLPQAGEILYCRLTNCGVNPFT